MDERKTGKSETYGRYQSVPGMQEFLAAWEDEAFETVWQAYDGHLRKMYGEDVLTLQPGNSEDAVLTPFRMMDKEPIEDFLSLYRMCNGEDSGQWLDRLEVRGSAYGHLNGYPLITLEEILSEVEFAQQAPNAEATVVSIPPGYVKDHFMLVDKVPIYYDGGGNFTALDLDPDEQGTYGQVISVDHESDERIVLVESLKEYIIILFYFVKELGVIDNGDDFEGEQPMEFYMVDDR